MDPQDYTVEGLVCDESFQAYCLGMSEKDRVYWQTWEQQHPACQQTVASAKRLILALSARQGSREEQLSALKDGLDRQMALRSLLRSSDSATDDEADMNVGFALEEVTPIHRHSRWLATLRIAACFLLLLGMSYGIYRYIVPAKPAFLEQYDYYSGAGHKTILLPDSSVVVLNRNSHLHIDRTFDPNHRSVRITGEGYFDIKHDPAHPFIVSTEAYTIHVLGTIFNVRAYPGEGITATALIRGKVEITTSHPSSTAERVVLKPDQKFVLPKGKGHIKKRTSAAASDLEKGTVVVMQPGTEAEGAKETAWARKRIHVANMRLSEIGGQLEQWYGVDIIIDSAVADYRYTATFEDETITKVLDVLQASYPFSYKVKGNTIHIEKQLSE